VVKDFFWLIYTSGLQSMSNVYLARVDILRIISCLVIHRVQWISHFYYVHQSVAKEGSPCQCDVGTKEVPLHGERFQIMTLYSKPMSTPGIIQHIH
jgi:hypothetical protein